MCITASLCCMAESDTALYINYPSINIYIYIYIINFKKSQRLDGAEFWRIWGAVRLTGASSCPRGGLMQKSQVLVWDQQGRTSSPRPVV